MFDGDETFVICGKEINDAIEVNRIEKVKLNQETNCYTAVKEHEPDETVVTVYSDFSPTYDNENATPRFINTIKLTEGGSSNSNSESQINVIKEHELIYHLWRHFQRRQRKG